MPILACLALVLPVTEALSRIDCTSFTLTPSEDRMVAMYCTRSAVISNQIVFGHPGDNHKFLVCTDVSAGCSGTCQNGAVFDNIAKSCGSAPVSCTLPSGADPNIPLQPLEPMITNPCNQAGLRTCFLFKHNMKNRFIICDRATTTNPKVGQCMNGFIFNFNRQVCESSQDHIITCGRNEVSTQLAIFFLIVVIIVMQLKLDSTYLRVIGGMSLVWLLIISRGQKVWYYIDLILSVLAGCAFLILAPQFLRSQTDVHIDTVHLFMIRSFGIVLIGSAYLWWQVRNSKDVTVHTTLMWARVIGGFSALLAQLFAQFFYKDNKTGRMTEEHLYISVVSTVLWTLGNVIYCLRSKDWGGYMETQSKLNTFLRNDFVMTLMLGIMFFAFPVWMLRMQTNISKLNGVHAHLYRVFGSALISSAIISGRASNFLIDSDKRSQLYARLYINIALIILFAVSYLSSKHLQWSAQNTPFVLGGVAMWTLNALFGCYSSSYHRT
ncbi:unnamed protein product [Acanthosepion pharaonis]|uniref:Chitin-binding type-2 domain-containing protein n=1 Tax=Acanthosepion pharaonis TaxID=158019 RepID=A0A812CJZ9_ACAPH|nr:unnamed protein product [Sepia pharaonis]